MRILGIDPGYAIVGFGVVDYAGANFAPIEYGAILTEAHTPFTDRLCAIDTDIHEILRRYEPDCMAVEKLFFTNNRTTGIDVAQARGILILAAAKRGYRSMNIPLCRSSRRLLDTVRLKNRR